MKVKVTYLEGKRTTYFLSEQLLTLLRIKFWFRFYPSILIVYIFRKKADV